MGPSEQPWGSCHSCWQLGHIARECPSARKGSPKGKGQLWAGHTQANWAQSKHGGESEQRYTSEQLQNFGMANPDLMELFLKVKPDGTEQLADRANAARRGRPGAKSVHTAMASSMEISDTFVPTDAERQRRLNRPLHQKRTRDKSKPGRPVELWMDSGASENLGPLDEVQAKTRRTSRI